MAGNSADTGRSVTNKVISILLTFTNGSTYSLTEIARLTGLPISTAHRLATELAAWGILERTDDGQYQAGVQLKVIGSQATLAPTSLHEKARRVMEDLATATARTNVRLGVLRDLDVVYIEKLPGSRPVSMFYEAAVAPAHATAMGKALLAFSEQHVVDEVIGHGLPQFTPYTLTTPERLRRALAVTRLTRVAMCRHELDLRTSAVAVPVFGAGGAVVAALELEARDPQDLRRLQPPLIVAGRILSRELAATHHRGHFALTAERHFGGTVSCHPAGAVGASDRRSAR
jgi:DNA-binding IclR family transcriptional regulator